MEQNSVGTNNPILLDSANNSSSNQKITIHKYPSKSSSTSYQIDLSTLTKDTRMNVKFNNRPTSKLEHIEKILLDTKSCEVCATTPIINNSNYSTKNGKVVKGANLYSSSGIINTTTPNAVLNNHNCCNKILTNLVLFDEPKIFSLQRSISEKLRNSFKNTTNINILQGNSGVSKETSQLRVPRKWHSERCRISNTALSGNNVVKPPSSRFSTQIPLNNHYKAILAQYTYKAKQENNITNELNQSNKAGGQCSKINQKFLKLNKKFPYVKNSTKLSSQCDFTNQENQSIYPYLENESNETSSSSSTFSENEQDDNNHGHNIKKNKARANYLRMLKYRESKLGQKQSNETDIDTDDDLDEAANFDYNARLDFLREKYLDLNNNEIEFIAEIDANLVETASVMQTSSNTSKILFYERVLAEEAECMICCDILFLNERQCCQFQCCNKCINTYIQTHIKEFYGSIRIECLNVNEKCNKLIHRDEINERMNNFDKDALKIYQKCLGDANKDPNCKTCPRCSHIMTIKNTNEIKRRPTTKSKLKFNHTGGKLTKVQCNECQLVWCFQCHAPWHDGITCSEFRRGDRMLKYWANEVHYGQQNAQLCPKCRIYIQRTKGCDHMVCTFCQTDFCYKCGCKFRRFKFIGDHYSKLSILGCKYSFYPGKPAKRRVIRGSVLCGKVLATPLVVSAAVVIGVGALAVGCVALPAYGSFKLIKHIQKNHNYPKSPLNNTNSNNINSSNKLILSIKHDNEQNLRTQSELTDLPQTSGNVSKSTELNLIPREATIGRNLKHVFDHLK